MRVKSLAVAVAAGGMFALSAPSAFAASAPASAPARAGEQVNQQAGIAAQGNSAVGARALCTLKLGKPYKKNSTTTSRVETLNNCAGVSLKAGLQYHRWYGWSGLSGSAASKSWSGNRRPFYLGWNCKGKGNHNYRTYGIVNFCNNVGRGNSPHSRFTC